MIEEFENAGVAAPIDDSPSAPPAEVMVMFSDVSVKADKTFVVTVAGNRCHVTQDYNKPLYQAIRAYLDEGGSFQNMRKMLLSSQIRLYLPGFGLKQVCKTRKRSFLNTATPGTWKDLHPLRLSSSPVC